MLLLRSQLPLDALIRSLAPAAWFRQGVGITVTGSGVSQWDDQSGNGRHLLQGTDAARPIDLPFSGTRYLYLPGVAGNYASTPDSVPLSITGSIDIAWRMSMDDWTPAAGPCVLGTFNGTTGFEVQMAVTTGRPIFIYGYGASFRSASATAAPTVSDGAALWLRVTRDKDVGVMFYTAPDSSTVPTSWTQLGTTVATTNEAMADSAALLTIGGRAASLPLFGRIYRAIIKNGIDGTTVVDFNPADADGDGDTSFASSTTGETWTINSTGSLPAQIVGRSSVLFNGTSHYLKCNAFTLNQPSCGIAVMKQLSWTNSDRIWDGNTADSFLCYQNTVPLNIAMYAGLTIDGNPDPAIGDLFVLACTYNGASSAIRLNNNAAVTGDASTSNAGGFTLGARSLGTNNANIQVYEVIVLPIAPSTAQLDRLVAGLMARHGVA